MAPRQPVRPRQPVSLERATSLYGRASGCHNAHYWRSGRPFRAYSGLATRTGCGKPALFFLAVVFRNESRDGFGADKPSVQRDEIARGQPIDFAIRIDGDRAQSAR